MNEKVKELIKLYHHNLGHPSKQDFIRVLKAAQANVAVLQYGRKEFVCPDCEANQKLRAPRKAVVPRTYEFNQTIALDTIFLKV